MNTDKIKTLTQQITDNINETTPIETSVKEQLARLPLLIAAKQTESNELQAELDKLHTNRGMMEGLTRTDVLETRDETTDKPVYSNESARKNEVDARLAADSDYQENQSKIRGLQSDKNVLGVEVECLGRLFRGCVYRVRLMEVEVARGD